MDDSVFRGRMGRLAGEAEHPEEDGPEAREGALRCMICGHAWMPRSRRSPHSCPRCHSTLWDREAVKTVMCMRCGHSWNTTRGHPDRCPSCKSKKWDLEGVDIVCKQCGAKWTDPMRSGGEPACPSCGQSSRELMKFSKGQRRRASANVPVSMPMIMEMRGKRDDASKVRSLVRNGLKATDAKIIVRFDRGMRVVPISKELDVSLEKVMAAVVPYIEACENDGGRI